MLRPMRPKPLIPTLVISNPSHACAGTRIGNGPPWAQVMLCGATRPIRRSAATRVVSDVLESAQAVVDRRLRQFHPLGELAEVEPGIGGAPLGHLAQCGRQPVELSGRFEPLDRGGLAKPGTDGLADVGRLEVEP